MVLSVLVISLACQLTSPTPVIWEGTATALIRAETNAVILATQRAIEEENVDLLPTSTSAVSQPTKTPTPEIIADGPWLVYSAPDGSGIHAYDGDTHEILSINLPDPIYTTDLKRGLSPDRKTLVVRAGSPENFDELALYQINLPSLEVTKLSPLLSLDIQRDIVNQESVLAQETLQVVTDPDGIAWSPNGRFLAFTAALDNDSSDLYVWDTLNQRVERLNGLSTQNTSLFWSPTSNWLISQELGNFIPESGWRSENVMGLQMPGFYTQTTIYLPELISRGEVFVGWLAAQIFLSYSETPDGATFLRQVDLEIWEDSLIFDGFFEQISFDPESKSVVLILSEAQAAAKGMAAGVYLLEPEKSYFILQQAGNWQQLRWDPGGRFVATGSQGLIAFEPGGDELIIPGEINALISPDGYWMVAWGDSEHSSQGLRLYQPDSDRPLQTITDQQVENVIWAQDSKSFFLYSEGKLYRVSFPSLSLVEIDAGFNQEELAPLIWVN
jgi:WD40 repeat protein